VKSHFHEGKKITGGKVIQPKHYLTSRSSNGRTIYTTILWADGDTSCDCPAWRFEKDGVRTCKHVKRAVHLTADVDETGTQPVRSTSAAVEEPRLGISKPKQRSRIVDT
jgi:hypothetical protein